MTKEEFIKEYNELVARGGWQIVSQLGLIETKKQDAEETREPTKEASKE